MGGLVKLATSVDPGKQLVNTQGDPNMCRAFVMTMALLGCAAMSVARADVNALDFELKFHFDAHDVDPSNFQGSLFYLNDNLRGNGDLIAGQIGHGVWEIDPDGNVVHSIQTNETLSLNNAGAIGDPPIGAKSAFALGSFVYLAANNRAGLSRFDRVGPQAWNPNSLLPLRNLPGTVESIATDGLSRLYSVQATNDDAANPTGGGQDTVTAFELRGLANDFQLVELWKSDVNSTITHPDPQVQAALTPRFRGIADGGNGFVYGVDNGNGGAGHIWAFDSSDGTATQVAPFEDPRGLGENWITQVINAGRAPDDLIVPTEYNAGFGAIVRDVPSDPVDELFVVTSGGFLRVYDLLDPTTVGDFRDFDLEQLLGDAGLLPREDSRVAGFGLAFDELSDTLYLSYQAEGEGSSRSIAGFRLTANVGVFPEQGSFIVWFTTLTAAGIRRRR